MAEKRIEVRTIMVRLTCDKCGEGEMKPTGVCLTSNPPQYMHKCDKCGAEISVFDKTYPYIEYEEVTHMEWQPIETAPTDGTEVRVCRVYEDGSARYAVAKWNGREWRDMGDIGWAGMYGDDGNQPTHWAALNPPT